MKLLFNGNVTVFSPCCHVDLARSNFGSPCNGMTSIAYRTDMVCVCICIAEVFIMSTLELTVCAQIIFHLRLMRMIENLISAMTSVAIRFYFIWAQHEKLVVISGRHKNVARHLKRFRRNHRSSCICAIPHSFRGSWDRRHWCWVARWLWNIIIFFLIFTKPWHARTNTRTPAYMAADIYNNNSPQLMMKCERLTQITSRADAHAFPIKIVLDVVSTEMTRKLSLRPFHCCLTFYILLEHLSFSVAIHQTNISLNMNRLINASLIWHFVDYPSYRNQVGICRFSHWAEWFFLSLLYTQMANGMM